MTSGPDIRSIGVVGSGLMGAGITEVCARAGLDVVVREVSPEAAAAGRQRITASLDRALRSGKIAEKERDAALGRIRVTDDFDALADRDAVIEAIAEDERLKTEVFAALDKVVKREDAILASNTSSIPIMKLAVATTRPQHVIGIHFFNPVPVLGLVEIVPSLLTSRHVIARTEHLVDEVLGKQAIRAQDRAGFIVNALLIPSLLSAIRMVESGTATAKDIDTGMVLGCAHPMGPLRLADLIGLDTVGAIAASMYEEYKEPLYSAPPLLLRMIEAGLLGRKSGHGFYPYDKQGGRP
ncbi:3-hydroxybutyryl-CoA dehydrogenase [Streptomyces plumbiresistens]|uniref:3-hydroxybutyryl-CoA dehydrogenase n=1 Tax=Streptomyces plumbiresistens TaxID=511811 RepID=A0ABP7SLX0_9ACTN